MELLQNLRDVFIKGAFNDKNKAGEECYNYMTNNFRMTISFFMVKKLNKVVSNSSLHNSKNIIEFK